MNRKIVFVMILLLFIKNSASVAKLLDRSEYLTTTSIIENFDIQHLFIISNLDQENFLENVKIFYKDLMTCIMNYKQFTEYFQNDSFPSANSLIIMKEKNLLKIIKLFKHFETLKILHRVHRFTWLIYLDSLEFIKKIFIPYKCEFIICYQHDKNNYKLIEIYNVKNQSFLKEFGLTSYDKIIMAKKFFYSRRMNLNNTELILNIQGKPEDVIINHTFLIY